jgi:hypothetical protein
MEIKQNNKVTFNPPRPTINDEGFAEAVTLQFIKKYYPESFNEDYDFDFNEKTAGEIYESLIEEFHLWDDEQCLMEVLIKHHDWSFTEENWSNIQEFSDLVRNTLKAKEQVWFEVNAIQPPFPVGATVKYRRSIYTIHAIDDYYIARYILQDDAWRKKHGENGGTVVKFEDVELVEAFIEEETK